MAYHHGESFPVEPQGGILASGTKVNSYVKYLNICHLGLRPEQYHSGRYHPSSTRGTVSGRNIFHTKEHTNAAVWNELHGSAPAPARLYFPKKVLIARLKIPVIHQGNTSS